ncbi:hypothetical protein BSKO_00515 [Bryopsis sp. KO-2023]|nr:hypothetical protein BSKO_00515 [Bryopsis sp. KO-2023]
MAGRPCHQTALSPGIFFNDVIHWSRPHACGAGNSKSRVNRRNWQQPAKKSSTPASVGGRQHMRPNGKEKTGKVNSQGGYDVNPMDDIITSGLFDDDPMDQAITSAILKEVDASKKASNKAGGSENGRRVAGAASDNGKGRLKAQMGKKSVIRRGRVGFKEKVVIKNSQARVGRIAKQQPRKIVKEPKAPPSPVTPTKGSAKGSSDQGKNKKGVELLAKPGLPVKLPSGGWQPVEIPHKVNFIQRGDAKPSSADWVPFQGVSNNKFGVGAGPAKKVGGVMSRDQTASASTSGNGKPRDIREFRTYGRGSYGRGAFIPTTFPKKASKLREVQPEPMPWDELQLGEEDAIRRVAHQISRVVSDDLGVAQSMSVESSIDDSSEAILDEMAAESSQALSKKAERKILRLVSKLPSPKMSNELEQLANFEMNAAWCTLEADDEFGVEDSAIEEDEPETVMEEDDLDLMVLLVLVNQLSRNGGPKAAMMVLDVMRSGENVGYPIESPDVYKELLHGCDMCANGPVAAEIFDLMQAREVELDVVSYNHAISAHAKTANVKKVQELFESMNSDCVIPNTETYNRMLICAERARDWESALEIYGAMRSRGIARTSYTYRSLIGALAGGNKDDLALKCLEWMADDDVVPNDLVFDVLVRHFLGKHKDIDTAMSLIRSAEGFGVVFELSTLRRFVEWALNRSNMDMRHVMGVIQLMRDTGTMRMGKGAGLEELRENEVRVLYRIYCSLLAQIEEQRDLWESGLKIYNWMKEDELKMDMNVSKKVICMCWNAGQLELCSTLYKEAREMDLHKNISIAYGVCCAMAMLGQWEEVDVVLQEMRDHNVIENPGIYVSLMDIAGTQGHLGKGRSIFEQACLHLGNNQALFNAIINCFFYKPSQALELYQQMRRAGISGDRSTYMTLITAAAKETMIVELESIWQSMTSAGILADSGLYNTLLSGYYNAGMLDESLELYEQMGRTLLPTKNYSFKTVAKLLRKHGSEESAAKARSVLDWVEKNGIASSVTYSVAVDNCKENPEWQIVVDVFEETHYVQIQPKEHTFQLLFGLCAQKGAFEKALELKDDMEKAGISLSVNLMNALLMCCASVGNLDKGKELIAEARELGITPDVASFSILIGSCCHKNVEKGWRQALDLFVQMQRRGVAPNTVLYNALLKVSIEEGKVKSTMEMLAHMRRHSKCAPDKSTFSMLLGMLAKEERWEDASQLFLEAKERGIWTAFSFVKDAHMMDLHNMSQYVAEVALRTWLHHLRRGALENRSVDGRAIKIVTGWGRNSETQGQTKLKPVVEKLFLGGLGPALPKSELSIPIRNQGLYHIQKDVFYSWLLEDQLDLGIPKDLDFQMGSMPVALE